MIGLARMVVLAIGCALGACGSTPARVDRTQGISAEILWTSADRMRASYFTVGTDGMFTSAGGAYARERGVQFSTQLTDEDIAMFVPIARACIARAPSQPVDAGDRSEITITEAGAKTRQTVVGPDPSVDALLGFCRQASLRQFRDVIDSQPVAGERRR